MTETPKPFCPECEADDAPEALDRRRFIQAVGGGTAAWLGLSGLATAGPISATPIATGLGRAVRRNPRPAEELVRELFAGLNATQKQEVVLPWDHGAAKNALPTRLRMYNQAILKKEIGENYTKPQQELIGRILKAISSDEEGYRRITRNGTFDGSGALEHCGALIFGDPSGQNKFSWVFTGHHLTVRCDGNSEEGAAFGGPMYYGHSPNGYSQQNCFFYQTRGVLGVFDALSEEQRKKAIVTGTPGEGAASVQFRKVGLAKPGIGLQDLSADQRTLVEKVMRDVLSPYRKEDADEVMDIVKANGGMERIHLAFYQDAKMNDAQPWHFWRLEGPGFVWNYRVLPHVHTYVNISSKA